MEIPDRLVVTPKLEPRRRWEWAWAGLIVVIPTAILAARLVWEQTWLSVREGPQDVGLSLAHSPLVILFLAPLAGALWLVAEVAIAVRRRSLPSRIRLGLLSAYGLSVFLMLVPFGYWQRLLVSLIARSAHVGDSVADAAATGDLATVKAFLAAGVPVDVRNEHNGATALHMAALQDQITMIKYLLSKGADVNALNAYGDSPVDDALSNGHRDAAAVLEVHGGKDIHGSDAQRKRAIHEEVERDISRLGQRH